MVGEPSLASAKLLNADSLIGWPECSERNSRLASMARRAREGQIHRNHRNRKPAGDSESRLEVQQGKVLDASFLLRGLIQYAEDSCRLK